MRPRDPRDNDWGGRPAGRSGLRVGGRLSSRRVRVALAAGWIFWVALVLGSTGAPAEGGTRGKWYSRAELERDRPERDRGRASARTDPVDPDEEEPRATRRRVGPSRSRGREARAREPEDTGRGHSATGNGSGGTDDHDGPHGDPRMIPVSEICVVGNSVIPPDEMSAMVDRYEGRSCSLSQLKRLALEISRAYHNRGFYLARAFLPAQELDGGIVRIQVVEGRLGRVLVSGNHHDGSEFLRGFFAPELDLAIQRMSLERSVLLLNRFTDLNVQLVLGPGLKEGTSDAHLKVCDSRPLHVELDVDNYGSRLLGEVRGWLGLLKGRALFEGELV
ncbi:MAG: ShlB/FhaC/HecB family hemolysin secretion/activation protein, partial [Candidatus Riflebacteria bacterium]|nr:ShlB/FhaC/HecB family hemolysin secretion/activation protein [Candidatus Riflebacteria bacterium]